MQLYKILFFLTLITSSLYAADPEKSTLEKGKLSSLPAAQKREQREREKAEKELDDKVKKIAQEIASQQKTVKELKRSKSAPDILSLQSSPQPLTSTESSPPKARSSSAPSLPSYQTFPQNTDTHPRVNYLDPGPLRQSPSFWNFICSCFYYENE